MGVYITEQGSNREWGFISLSWEVLENGVYITEQGSIREWGYILLSKGVIENGGIYH